MSDLALEEEKSGNSEKVSIFNCIRWYLLRWCELALQRALCGKLACSSDGVWISHLTPSDREYLQISYNNYVVMMVWDETHRTITIAFAIIFEWWHNMDIHYSNLQTALSSESSEDTSSFDQVNMGQIASQILCSNTAVVSMCRFPDLSFQFYAEYADVFGFSYSPLSLWTLEKNCWLRKIFLSTKTTPIIFLTK